VHDLRGIPAEFLDPGALRRQIIRFVADGDRADGGVFEGNREFGAERVTSSSHGIHAVPGGPVGKMQG
jgi:hypothetical protein